MYIIIIINKRLPTAPALKMKEENGNHMTRFLLFLLLLSFCENKIIKNHMVMLFVLTAKHGGGGGGGGIKNGSQQHPMFPGDHPSKY